MSKPARDEVRQKAPPDLSPEPTDEDVAIYRAIVSPTLTPEQERRILTPEVVYPKQRSVLAIHWHPEHVPIPLCEKRIDATFPNRTAELVIPTQHNELLSCGAYTGAEVDCAAPEFDSKVQLLLHFATESIEGKGDVLRAMIAHTHRYRSSQLYEFVDSVVSPALEERVAVAADRTGADEELVAFVRAHVARLRTMMDRLEAETPRNMLKNKLVRNYFDALRGRHDGRLINHAQLFLKMVKQLVKEGFALEFFYDAREVIEEARALGACIVVPHPEQFWPILLDDLDIDAIEVWNPQSFRYTQFLIDVVRRQNKTAPGRQRPVLLTMGDDTHMGEKVTDPRYQDPAKGSREIGVQPPWDDPLVRKRLIAAKASRLDVICEYRERLG